MDYLAIRHLHVGCVAISVALFVLRGGLQFAAVKWRRSLALRVLPHLNDTVLLGAAIALAMTLHQYPFVHGWLTAKLLGLIAYVFAGRRALADATPAAQRLPYFLLALACVGYIIAVALTRSPIPI